ncbi:rod shape-determining protein RodA [Aeromonas schubertii]|uniref:Peptidoglycan glycosyltransferase MrdB n=1 Tax=Aeromonas schubertii TaxID=652 RepID=A0A0S2SD46_9GAMM|nr:rod shape-determining protein RodA [Aeromonas schubertii]ALP39554.1 rod shape-determining protein RodA [Aeromonas schubertii]KUE79485.1 rod shape-determining protein RodA [Aeromonas schubertii]MBZ6065491.1 rod shape-determining protein RodA [Aeromonas schubertii]MBZ6072251.1 rod shape-determining protein RodA [Aeromonas schubertii]
MSNSERRTSIWYRMHIDLPLLLGLLAVMALSMVVLYSASGQSMDDLLKQAIRGGLSLAIMLVMAQFSPSFYARWAVPLFVVVVLMLIAVDVFGHIGKGAQRWLDLGFMKFQPSELMKLSMPIMIAVWLSRHSLPPKLGHLVISIVLVLFPTLLIAAQPDLGTSILVAASGFFVIFLAGISWWLIGLAVLLVAAFLPVLWFFLMHDYQRQRVLMLIDPEKDPLGRGYHIIQSKIAIGSGGIFGKGWLEGTQSQLEFLPERHTDFIFAVYSEEFGLIGVALLLVLYLYVISRSLYISMQAQNSFERLLGGALTLTFFVYVFVNMGMVSGILPVVGVPLPLVSYGGTSMVTLMAGFGILMSIHTHRRLLA